MIYETIKSEKQILKQLIIKLLIYKFAKISLKWIFLHFVAEISQTFESQLKGFWYDKSLDVFLCLSLPEYKKKTKKTKFI